MLVLSRKKNETVIISAGDRKIQVTVVEIRGDKVRIGFLADPQVKINRLEVQEEIDSKGGGG